MRKLLLLLLLAVTACGAPADDHARRWVEFLDTQREMLETGEFDAARFQHEGEQIVDELVKVRSPKDHRIALTSATLKEWERAGEEFRQAANRREAQGDPAAAAAFSRLLDRLKAGR